MPSSRRMHTVGLKGKTHEKVELNRIWLDWLPECDLDEGRGWFWEVDGKSSPGLIVPWDCCFCHRLPLLLPHRSRATWSLGDRHRLRGLTHRWWGGCWVVCCEQLGLADQSM